MTAVAVVGIVLLAALAFAMAVLAWAIASDEYPECCGCGNLMVTGHSYSWRCASGIERFCLPCTTRMGKLPWYDRASDSL